MALAWFRRQLLSWYRRNQRDLPWRRTRDPYAIWVSEVMLQQTQVATVIPYYHRFLAAFPTLQALAAAGETEVLRLWEGLGYYRRAHFLHAAARRLILDHGGIIPDTPEVLAALPGMGRYTVGAVLSQAFDRRLPILEANSRRVLARYFAGGEDLHAGKGDAQLWQLAAELLPRQRTGEFNQALMELGALVCTAAVPKCRACPLRHRCGAHARGWQTRLPLRARAPAMEHASEAAVVPSYGGRVLILRRPEEGRWAGLWEFPRGACHAGETPLRAGRRVLREVIGLQGRIGPAIGVLVYGVTKFRIEMVCLRADCSTNAFRVTRHVEGRWVHPHELIQLPLAAPQRRLAQLLI